MSGNPNLQPETAYEWTYGAVVTPGKWWSPLQGLTLQADFYHIDLRAVTAILDPQFLIDHEDQFPGQVIRGPSTGPDDPFGPIVLLLLPEQNLGRIIQEGWDYEVAYSFDTSRLGHGDWGTLTAILNGTYIDRVVLQAVVGGPEKVLSASSVAASSDRQAVVRLRTIAGTRVCSMTDRRAHSWLDSIPALPCTTSASIGILRISTHDGRERKIREWTTLDWILNYTFNFTAPAAQNEVAGYCQGRRQERDDERR